MRTTRLWWLVAVMVLLTACGSTVSVTERTAIGGDGMDALGGPSADSQTAAPATGTPSGPSAVTGGVAAQRPTGVPSEGSLPGSGPGVGTAPRPTSPATRSSGIGVTDRTISLGIVVLKNGDKFASGLGFQISFGDAEKEFDAVIDDLNRRGGVLGRKVVPVIAYYDLGSAAVDAEALQSAICAKFTQDHHVFAVLMPYNPLPSFRACLAKRRTLLLNGSAASTDDVEQAALNGSYVAPALASYSRYPKTLVAELAAQGFFSDPLRKAGILVIDTPDMVRAAERAMKPAIEASGTKVELINRVSTGGGSTSDISGAVLKFKASGITHVFFVQAAGGLPLYFMQSAESQQYFPKYGLSSFEVPGFFLEGQVPASQLANASGIGWQPFFDVKPGQFATRPAEQRCFDIIRTTGEQNVHRQSNITATPVCDLVWVFEAAGIKAGPALSAATWLEGLRRLGSSYESPVALRPDFGSGRADGASGYRRVAFVGDCGCFRYTGPLRTGWL